MKTIIYVGGFELPDKNAAAHRVISNAKILRDLGYNVVLIDSNREINTSICKQQDCFGFKRYSIQKTNRQLYFINDIVSIIKQCESVCAVIAYNYPAIGLWQLKSYCAKKGIKLIADVTEWYGAKGNNIIRRLIKGLDSYLRMNIIQPKLDGIIAISRYLENYYKNKTTTVFLPPLTDLSEEKWKIIADNTDNHMLRILYAGNPGKDKDKLNFILRALKECDTSKVIFRIVGITRKQYLTYYPDDEPLVNDLKGCVFFLGRKSHLEVIKELKSADFSMFYREVKRLTMAGFPTKYSEAITCGIPVLTNKTSDLKDYLVDGVNGFWIDDLNRVLSKLLSDNFENLKAMKKNVDNHIFDYHNYLVNMELFLDKIFKSY